MDYAAESLKKHYEWQGKIEMICRAPLETREDLSLAYTPGVAQPCLEIRADADKSYALTRRSNLVAVVTLVALLNALKVTGKKMGEIRVVTSGAGAAGIAIIRLLLAMGLKNVILCDRAGAIYAGREHLNQEKAELAAVTNREGRKGTLAEVLKGADVFIGVSAQGCVTEEMVRSMNPDPIIFAMANPTPEIMPELAYRAGAAVVGTGRSDFPNQINNVLAFPGIFRGALDVRAKDINDAMKIAAAEAIAGFVEDVRLSADYIIPSPLGKRVAQAVAAAAARETGVARI